MSTIGVVTYIVYKHTNLNNGKAYIGWTAQSLLERWECHLIDARRGSHAAIRKHGSDSWVHEVIEFHDIEAAAKEAEVRLITEYQTFCYEHPDKGYNMTRGGDGVSNPTSELRHKMGSGRRGKRLTEDHKRQWHKHNHDPKSEMTKLKMSQSATGEKNHFFGKQHIISTREKISASLRGKRNKAVLQLDEASNVIARFESAVKASESTGIACSTISMHCRGHVQPQRWVFDALWG